MLSDEEVEWLNSYHRRVYDAIAPHVSMDEREWLREATKEIRR